MNKFNRIVHDLWVEGKAICALCGGGKAYTKQGYKQHVNSLHKGLNYEDEWSKTVEDTKLLAVQETINMIDSLSLQYKVRYGKNFINHALDVISVCNKEIFNVQHECHQKSR